MGPLKLEIEFRVGPDWYGEDGRPLFGPPCATILRLLAERVEAGGIEAACGRVNGLAWVVLDYRGTVDRKRARARRRRSKGVRM